MKKTSEYKSKHDQSAVFPYNDPLTSYVYVSVNGIASKLPTDMSYEDAYKALSSGNGTLIVAHVYKREIEMYLVDDIHTFGIAKHCA